MMKFSRGYDSDNRLSISVDDCWLYGWVRRTKMWIYVEVVVMMIVAEDFGCVRRVDTMVTYRDIYDDDGSG